MPERETPEADRRLYANFPRRLNGLSIDSVLVATYAALLLAVASSLEAATGVRLILWALLLGGLLLYEPITVWRFGGTVGHHLMNLRVVDSASGGNVSLGKALGRVVVKVFLGILSFVTMTLTKEHQAVHDLLTGSAVCIRDPAKARPWHYTEAEAE